MPIEFSCPCGKRFRVNESLAGKQATCKLCLRTLQVPATVELVGPEVRGAQPVEDPAPAKPAAKTAFRSAPDQALGGAQPRAAAPAKPPVQARKASPAPAGQPVKAKRAEVVEAEVVEAELAPAPRKPAPAARRKPVEAEVVEAEAVEAVDAEVVEERPRKPA